MKPLFSIMAASTVLIGCSSLFASEADEAIEKDFKNSYIYKTQLNDDSIKVDSKNGLVTLTGKVADENHKAIAQAIAENLPGVSRVSNHLVTVSEAKSENADTWMGRKVRLALLFHSNVNLTKTTVTVKDGVVTLSGEAANIAQKELTAEYAKDVMDVKEVVNNMTVASTPPVEERTTAEKIDDASVTAQVRTTLLTHRSTSAAKTKIVTRDGKVTVTGIANNDAEKSMVTKIINDIRGVSSVDNQMTVNEVQTK